MSNVAGLVERAAVGLFQDATLEGSFRVRSSAEMEDIRERKLKEESVWAQE